MVTDSTLVKLANEYKALKETQQRLTEEADAAKSQAAEVNKRLLDHMDAIGVSHFDLEDKKFYVKTISSAKIVEGMKEKVMEWLKGDEEGKNLVREAVDSRQLSGFLFERFSSGGTLPPKELIEDPAKWTGRVVQMNANGKKD